MLYEKDHINLGMDTIHADWIAKNESGRLYIDYANNIWGQLFYVRLYLGDDLIKALGKPEVLKAFRDRPSKKRPQRVDLRRKKAV